MSEENNQDKKETTNEELAAMINKGFNSTIEKINQSVAEKIDQLRSDLKADIAAVKLDTENIKADLNKKVDKIEYNTLEYRVKRLEGEAA